VLASGVRRVVVGALDPDGRVAGRGAERLRRAGLEVATGVAQEEVEALDPGYFHHRRTGRPRVTWKAGLTLDGQVAAADGSARWLTGPEARRDGHRLRAEADAVLVGAGTVIADDPALTVRLPDYEGPQPRPVIVAGHRTLPGAAQLWERGPLVFAPDDSGGYPAEVVVLPGPGGVDLEAACDHLGELDVLDVLVEGGPAIAASLLERGLVDRGVFYLAARLAGGTGVPVLPGVFPTVGAARPVEVVGVERVGADVRIEFEFTGEAG
jgi:diaminohydroxyphosphoribosylaminopyrimidine deaminase/5-amino-6-(5-phosphoribosylamino)uracil reductase